MQIFQAKFCWNFFFWVCLLICKEQAKSKLFNSTELPPVEELYLPGSISHIEYKVKSGMKVEYEMFRSDKESFETIALSKHLVSDHVVDQYWKGIAGVLESFDGMVRSTSGMMLKSVGLSKSTSDITENKF